MTTIMKTIPAGEFKTHCLRIMDEVRKRRQPVLITKKGVPVAKLVPVEDTKREVFGCLEGVIEIVGDIEAPLVEPEAWEVD
jgi:prevent-host-death family protein